MRILALDHGTVRIGVAVSDELKLIAQPLEFIPAQPFEGFLARLRQLLQEKEVERIIVGLPRNMDGSYGPAAEKVGQFVATLKGLVAVPIETLDERLTTVQAHRVLREVNTRRDQRKKRIDQTAAALLLQSYLDRIGSA
jgi:putative holliday junction resolvase